MFSPHEITLLKHFDIDPVFFNGSLNYALVDIVYKQCCMNAFFWPEKYKEEYKDALRYLVLNFEQGNIFRGKAWDDVLESYGIKPQNHLEEKPKKSRQKK